jgi:outer membrane receptor protein involved in Fe transport
MKRRARAWAGAAALAVWLAPGAAPAERPEVLDPPGGEPIEVNQLELESLLELEVSAATKQPVKIGDLPSTASAVTREQIRDYGWRSLNDLLYTLPGFFRSQDFERRLVGFRGERERWNANRLLLTMDGLPHNNIETGAAFTWDTTPLYFAREVEVVRGPASAVHGSNAMHGVVAVETVSADDLGDGGVEARVRAAAGRQTIDAVGAQKGDWADAVVGLSAHNADGDEYSDTDDSYRLDADGQPARFPLQDESSSSYLWLKVDPHAGPARGLQLSLHRQSEQTETGHGWSFWIPDAKEYVREQRTIADAVYRRRVGPVEVETAAQYQHEAYQAEIRLYPSGALDGTYPQGVTEVADTSFQSIFGRGQAELRLPRSASLLGGVEYTGVFYGGDDTHYANAQLVDPTGEYPQLDGFEPQGRLYEPIAGRPVHRVGVYAQAVSGELLGRRVELTLGARYDDLFYRYAALDQAGRPVRSDSHHQLSPRAGLVVRPTDSVRLKLMAGHAFRTPTIVELFSANSWTASSNPDALRPETTTSYEAAVDWAPAAPLRIRANAFYIHHRDATDYNGLSGLIENIFSNRRAGAELELLGEARLGRVSLDGFASASYVRLLDETVLDPELSESRRLVWAPSGLAKVGMRAVAGRFGFTAAVYYQTRTRRRSSDRADPMWNQLRPAEISAWLTTRASAFFRPRAGLRVGLEAENLLGSDGRVINPGAHSFDYRIAPREVLGVIELDL